MTPAARPPFSAAAVLMVATAACLAKAAADGITLADATLLLATAATVVWLFAYPLRIQPHDDLPLVIVPVLVALGTGKPLAALDGALLGLTIAGWLHPRAWWRSEALVSAVAVSCAAGVRMLLPLPAVPLRLGPLAAAAVTYSAIRTLLVALRLTFDEHMAWRRAFRVSATSIAASLAIPVLMAIVSVVIERLWLPHASRYALNALPLLAGSVVLQVFQPYAQRGREERRGLAITVMFADAMDVKDASTGLHSMAVAQLSRQIARTIGVGESAAHRAFLTGLLHDVGKVAVPDAILQKPVELRGVEREIMRAHVADGAAMVGPIAGLSDVAPFVRASHEHYDGSGYPDGLRGRAIPLAARIVAIADAYHALTNDRAYRDRRSPEAALAEIERCAGTQFDPELVGALRTVIAAAGQVPGPHAGPEPAAPSRRPPSWQVLLRRPAFALLWGGELVSFLGDEVFFIAITLWVFTLTKSAALLGVSLAVGFAGQAAFGFVAGVVADRVDRRVVAVVSDVGRALVVAALPFVLPHSLPLGFALLALLSIGSSFFRAAVEALLPSIVTRDEVPTANALFQTTERIAEVAGGVLGAAAVLALGYSTVMFAEAATFLVSAGCVLLMLNAPMVVTTAHLSAAAYGVVNSALGAGRLVTAMTLAGLVAGAFIYAIGNMLSRIINLTLMMQITPQRLPGRVIGNRHGLVRGTQLFGVLVFGRLSDAASPAAALWIMAAFTISGVVLV
jgi:putative nucleotidyltransferase with HDIG domain